MPDQKSKLVKADHIGVISFPHYMSDDDILKAIRGYDAADQKKQTHTTSGHVPGKITEQSEKTRQTKTAQPLSTATKPVTDFLSTPITDYADQIDKAFNRTLGLPEQNPLVAQNQRAVAQYDKDHPISGGVMQGVNEFAKGLTTPQNIGLLLAAPEWKIISAYFAGHAFYDSQRLAKQAEEAWKKGDKKAAADYATQAMLTAGLGGAAGAHAVADVRLPAGKTKPEYLPPEPKAMTSPTQPGPRPITIDALRENGVAPHEAAYVMRKYQPAPQQAEPVAVPGNIVYRSPISSPQQIGKALDRLNVINKRLESMPPPLEPIDDRRPETMARWKIAHDAWLKRAKPLLDEYRKASQDYNLVANKGVGHVRELPNGQKIVYLTQAGLNDMRTAIFGSDPRYHEYSLLGLSLNPTQLSPIMNNLQFRNTPFRDELTTLLNNGRDQNGNVIISAHPQPGETLSQVIGRLREELNHGWQHGLDAAALGNHIDPADQRELNASMPAGMQSHLLANYPNIADTGNPETTMKRVREATAKLMSFAPVEFGITEDEAAAYLFQYFNAVTAKHGAGTLDELVHVTNFARGVKEDYARSQQQPAGSVAGRAAGPGTLPGLPAERAGGYQGGPAPPQPGVSPTEPGFVPAPANLASLKGETAQRAPVSFVSPNTLNLTLDEARTRVNSHIQKRFEGTARDLATALGVSPSVRPVLGSWEGGAENSVIHEFPVGTDPDLVRYYNAILGNIGFQNSTGAFFPGEGEDRLYAFWTESPDISSLSNVLLGSGIENSTIEPAEGGHTVYLIGGGDEFREKVRKAANTLGVRGHVEEHSGTAEFPGNYTDREAAGRDFSSTVEALESRHPEWRPIRQRFESRPDIHSLHLLIQSTKELAPEPQIGVVHYSNAPGIEALDPSYYGQNPTHDVSRSVVNRPDLRRKESFPQYWNPETYVGDESDPAFRRAAAERFGARQFTYKGKVGAQGIYDFATDPDGILALSRKELEDQKFKKFGARLQPSDAEVQAYAIKRLKDLGYTGRRDINGLIASWEKIPVSDTGVSPAKDLDQAWDMSDQVAMHLQRKKWKWSDVQQNLSPEDVGNWDTKEKRDAITFAANQTPDDIEWDAAVKAGISGKLWYDRSSRAFDALVESQPDMFRKGDKNKFLNFVSALSPVQPVRQNLLMAINLWDKWVKAGRPVDVTWKDTKNFKGVANKNAKLFRILQGRGNTFGVDLPSRLYNGIRALQDQPMSGPKVSAFAPNLGKDVEKSTNDTWMAIFAGIDPNRINDPKYYQAVTAKVRAAARKNNIDVRQAQAAIWSFIKALAELSGWGKDRWIPPQEIIKKGWLTPELINRHAADFADLLQNDKEIRDRIEAIGGDLDALDKRLAKYVPERPEQGATAHTDPRLLNAAERLEAARANAKIEAHLARKSDAPNLFDTSFSDGITFNLRRNFDDLKAEAEQRRPTGLATMGEATIPKNLQDFIADAKRRNPEGQPIIEGRDFKGFFDTDNYDLRHSTGHNMLDPESVITGSEIGQGMTYANSKRQYPDIETYVKAASGDLSADELQKIAPRVRVDGGQQADNVPMDMRRLQVEAEQRNPSRERRRNPELRKRIDEMTPEEMRKLLLYDENTELPNARSFQEAQHAKPAPAVAMSDADGLKAFNDRFGYEAGNALLRAKADALRRAGLEAYHDKGDEFLYRGKDVDDLKQKLEEARDILRNTVFDVTMDDGTELQLKGVDFSYGVGRDLDEAEHGQHIHKAEREASGERKRGELRGITEIERRNQKHQGGEVTVERAQGEAAPIEGIPMSLKRNNGRDISVERLKAEALARDPRKDHSDPLSVQAPDGITYKFPNLISMMEFKREIGIE